MDKINYRKQALWYYGNSHDTHAPIEVFKSHYTPTQNTCGHKYAFCTGGFKTRKEAIQNAEYCFCAKVVIV